MAAGDGDEVWQRLQNVSRNDQVLEYSGHGRQIEDVGLAQARRSFTPDNSYFEIEIVNPGERCFIAIGIAREDHPPNSHLGWTHGSIAYHADDGQIFVGNGPIGEHFGSECGRGDRMGCGIRRRRSILDQEMEVEVYFKRNGDEVGTRQVRWPTGELYPSIGMLSEGERVRVDLRPARC